MMLCAFSSIKTQTGWQHTCQRCRAVRTTIGPNLVRQCDRAVQPSPVNSCVVLLRIGICHRCTERSAGCWKAVEYACQQEYKKAQIRAAETGSCPLNKFVVRGS